MPFNLMKRIRFIPTCMGNSSMVLSPVSRSSVHPHVHGELLSVGYTRNDIFGSSPRAWGTQCIDTHIIGNNRFIPTCMGNSRDL